MAEAITTDAFMAWAATAGVGFDPRFPDARSLALLPTRNSARFWLLPSNIGAWPDFTAAMLSGLDEWDVGYLWPRSGAWPKAAASVSSQEQVRDVITRGAGMPDGWKGAIRYLQRESPTVMAVLFVYFAFGGCVDEDLYFVPDHGKQLIHTDHHDVVHIECTSEDRVQKLVEHMADAGYHLPVELPDATFRQPYWMPQK